MTTLIEVVVKEVPTGFLVCSGIAASRHQVSFQIHTRIEVLSAVHSGLLPFTIGDVPSLSHFCSLADTVFASSFSHEILLHLGMNQNPDLNIMLLPSRSTHRVTLSAFL